MTQQSAAVQLTGSPHVLIVDDEEGIRELMSDNLSELGYTCHTASCGDDALALLSRQEVQVALLDVMMPGMTGLSLFQHLQERFPNIAVVFVTAVDDLSLAVEHLKSGAYDYVVKPVTRRRLHQVVGDALARREAGLEQQRLRALIEEQADRNARDLEAKARELSTLNRVFQEELNRKYTGEGSALESETESETTHGRRATLSLHEALKKRVSEYLHGHVQSKLLALQFRVGECQEQLSADPTAASRLLQDIKVDIQSVQENDIRRASHELYPTIVMLGLAPALRSLCDRFRPAVAVELKIDPEIEVLEQYDWKLFHEDFRVGVYRMVEESLENVVKHSRASLARVLVSRLPDQSLSVEIVDDGTGFEFSKVSSVVGLLSIRDYAEALGGRCQIGSTPGLGTRVRVILPDTPSHVPPSPTGPAPTGGDPAGKDPWRQQPVGEAG